ncbi:aminotransferase class I/II-fold pyridoxal phosphate-dependent enzyme [Pseudomonas juntendi]|uniref:aminotransferase class I/II-fold pyridoxal phosphate-dependent enzyme n=1 Tax=Pseudomonas TaxID=286 RepID=UPI0006D40C44|nr:MULTISPECIES: aminotransferase class I/II-fold pyridoxal phosphate-dependent enzyme [Pseudomonas]MDG9916921.1 aminotransferase class I/II-fold pyridoxal phosphate-dependent enzyme [Pseudomonas juntendi]MDH0504969.1 aminotransferase class I/II-fold pyridoxal phosphate-dependent enzyme [Pseudomonas juntendi]MDH1043273.1 aminotransferase class I/II-fold pyridoxal phosphate-dependent enzyme [Pseudomonas juntendi]
MARTAAGEFAYRRVYRYLEALIGQATAGGPNRLPSLRELSRRLRVSLATVQSAYSLLGEEGRVHCLPRSGYFVRLADLQQGGMPRQAPQLAQPLLERALFTHERRLARQRERGAGPWEVQGSARLRDALAERYTRCSRQYWRADDVQVAPDVPALLETLLAALALQSGTTVLVQSPCCGHVLRALARAGMRVLEVPPDPRGNPDLQAVARLLGCEPVRLLVMPSCLGLPQGRLVSLHYQQQLGLLLSQHSVWLLENDLDSELCYSGPPATRLRDWVDPRRLMIMGAFEAAVGPEAPYAYVLSLDTALAKAFCERAFRLAPLRLLALAHLLAKGDIEAQLVALRSNLQQRTQNLACALTAQFAQRVVLEPPQGGRMLWVRFEQPLAWDAIATALAGCALHALPGEQFSLHGRYRQHLALMWLGDCPGDLQQAVQRLAQALELRRRRVRRFPPES